MSDKKRTLKKIETDTKKELKIGKDTGRVKVYVRIRPFNKDEGQRQESSPLIVSEGNQIQVPDGRSKRPFQFDHIFKPEIHNDQVSSTLTKPLVSSALNGFNGTLMAYGQTGTGKTYTLMGPNGITSEVINQCFDRINQDKKHVYRVSVAYLQIYQEKIHDLLNANVKVELTIRESPKQGVYVENLSEFVVRTPAEVLSLLQVGRKRLVFAETKMNRMSSRSHSVLQMTIERKRCKDKGKDGTGMNKGSSKEEGVDLTALDNDVLVRGKIHICDLAGSERLKKTMATGDRLSEAQHINSSLLELGNVIQALADDKVSHIPFRNSVLTRLLQESLGGNCKTSLMVCVSPSERDLSETKCTLGFGSRAIKITNTAYVNMEVDFKTLSETLVRKMQEKEDEILQIKQSYEDRLSELQKAQDVKMKKIEEENANMMEKQDRAYQQRLDELERALIEAEDELEDSEKRCSTLKRQIMEMNACMKDEQHQIKILLLIEAMSMKLMATAETQCRAANSYQLTAEERGKLTRSVIQHVDSLMDYIKLTVGKEDMATTDDLKLLFASSRGAGNEEPVEFDVDNIRAKLLATKGFLDATMFDILKQHNVQPPTGAYEMGSSIVNKYKTSVGSLFKILVDKAMLSCIVILEKLGVEQRMDDASSTVDVFEQSDFDVDLSQEEPMVAVYEDYQETDEIDGVQKEEARRVKQRKREESRKTTAKKQIGLKDHPVTWDEMCDDFECTLSRIDNLLNESAGALDSLPQNNRKLYNDILDRTRLGADRLLANSSEDELHVKSDESKIRRRVSTRRAVRSFGMQTVPTGTASTVNRDVQTQTAREEKRTPSALEQSATDQLLMLQNLDGELTNIMSVNEELRQENARLKSGIKYLFLEDRQRKGGPTQVDHSCDDGPRNAETSEGHDKVYEFVMQTTARDSGFCDGKPVLSAAVESTQSSAASSVTIDSNDLLCGVDFNRNCDDVILQADGSLHSPRPNSEGNIEEADSDYLHNQLKALQWQVEKAEEEASCYFGLLSDIFQDSDLFMEFLALDSDILKLRDVIKNRRSHNSFKRSNSKASKKRQSMVLRGSDASGLSESESPVESRQRTRSFQTKSRTESMRSDSSRCRDTASSDVECDRRLSPASYQRPLSACVNTTEVVDKLSINDPMSLPIVRNTSQSDVIIQRSWSFKDLFGKRRPSSSEAVATSTVIQ